MNTISKVWFDNDRIFIATDEAKTYSRPLEAFPVLKDATVEERNAFTIGRFGDDIRWEGLDEDIHISSFFETTEPVYDNEVGHLFHQFPQLNVLAKYIYGIKRPTPERMQQIKSAMHILGQQLMAV